MARVWHFMKRSPLAVKPEEIEEVKALVAWLKSKYTPQEVATMLKVGHSTAAQWFNGTIRPGKDSLRKMRALKGMRSKQPSP